MDLEEILGNFDKIRDEHLRLTEHQIKLLKKLVTGQELDPNDKVLLRKLAPEGWNFNISGVDHKSNVKDFYVNTCLFEHLQDVSKGLISDIKRLKALTALETFPGVIEELLRQFVDKIEPEVKGILPDNGEFSIQQLVGLSQEYEKTIDVRFKCPSKKECKCGYRKLCDRQTVWNQIVYKIIKSYLFPGRGLQIGGDTCSLTNRIKERGVCGIRINYSK